MSNYQIGISKEIARLVTSEEADRVTRLMAKIYNRLVFAPPEWWVRQNVMRVTGGVRGQAATTPWAELVNLLGVSPPVAKKALDWMRGKRIIHYREVKGGREIEITFEGLIFPDSADDTPA